MNSETRNCQNCKRDFVVEPEDFQFYEKIKVPPPTWCPDCRSRRRMMWRNERTFHKRKDFFGNDVVSIYSSERPFTIYKQDYWWSDNWDPMEYGKDYDFSKSFFEQWRKLRDKIPLLNVSNSRAENSEFCNVNDKSKDCYLISASFENERVMYSNRVGFDKDCVDMYVVSKCELCYEDVACKESYGLTFSRNSDNCVNSSFLYDCRGCTSCFGCTNLRNKKYHFLNRPLSKEDYDRKISELNLGSYSGIKKARELFNEAYKKSIHRFAVIISSQNALGDNLINTKNCYQCFDLHGAEDCRYSNWGGFSLKGSYDGGPGIGASSELIYESFDTVNDSRNAFTSVVYDSHDVSYSFNCHNSSHLFGCIGPRNKQYCILNKQYTKEEYKEMVEKIKKHMVDMPYIDKQGRVYKYGEFFPPELSPFSYNETIAQEYFPLTREQAVEQGYAWKDPDTREYKIARQPEDLPDNIKDVSDDVLKEIIGCFHKGECNEQCTTAFKIIPQELQFYRKMNLPLPRLCPNCRHYQRLKQRNPLKLWKRQCMCNATNNQGQMTNDIYKNTAEHFHGDKPCPNEFETSYSPDRKEIVYCESCYQSEVV